MGDFLVHTGKHDCESLYLDKLSKLMYGKEETTLYHKVMVWCDAVGHRHQQEKVVFQHFQIIWLSAFFDLESSFTSAGSDRLCILVVALGVAILKCSPKKNRF
jgi:hypothetical protein